MGLEMRPLDHLLEADVALELLHAYEFDNLRKIISSKYSDVVQGKLSSGIFKRITIFNVKIICIHALILFISGSSAYGHGLTGIRP